MRPNFFLDDEDEAIAVKKLLDAVDGLG